MGMREKLIELYAEVEQLRLMRMGIGECVDILIANGVTVQEWISVKDDRKPNHGDIALCYMTFGEYRLLQWDDHSKLWVGDYMDFGFEDAAYWQMPQPPKGE